jgi:hypothetical protein
VGDPAGHAADGEHDGEHVGGDADGAHDDAAVEVHVGIELALDEVGVGEGDLLQPAGDVQQRVVDRSFGTSTLRHLA